jgi:3-hydroxyisobutyrate dehydrogenase-like beta-hydroxyacid dehydrogenase
MTNVGTWSRDRAAPVIFDTTATFERIRHMHIGFIGLGAMGRAMAKNLAVGHHQVTAWNRSGGKIDGVTMVETPDRVFDSDVVITMLSDDDAIRSVILERGLLVQARPGLIHVVTSTISVAFAHELVSAHASAGLTYVSAPVLGRPDVAAKGELNILAAGPAEALERLRTIFEIIGQRVWELGDAPPTANAAKIACNMMITMAIEAMAEAVVLTEASGLDRETFFELILGTLFGSRSYQVYSANIARDAYEPGFKAMLGLKDLRLAKEAAAEADRNLPMLDAVYGQMRETVDAGFGEKDWSIMAKRTISGTPSASLFDPN